MKKFLLPLVCLTMLGDLSLFAVNVSQVVYAEDHMSGELKVLSSDFDGTEHFWQITLPSDKRVKVTRINSTYLKRTSSNHVLLLVNETTDLITEESAAFAMGVYVDTISNASNLTLVIQGFTQDYAFVPKDPAITIRFAVIDEHHPSSETTYLNGDVEVASGMLFTSGYQDFMGTKVTAVLGDDYNQYTCFGSPRGGMIRGSNEGYLILGGNPNGYGNHNVYINRYTPNANVIMTASSGKVGIGVDEPKEKLHIAGAIRGTGTAGQLMIRTDSGYVYVGPTSTKTMDFNTNLSRYVFDKPIFNNSGAFSANNSNLTLQTNFTPRLTILRNNGYVGIGTTNPSYRLDVSGAIRASQIIATTKVGIGTTAPNYMLDVNGTMHASKIIATTNVGIGTATPNYMLDVNGTIRANEIIVNSGSADFVFDEDYNLRSLSEVHRFIQEHKHLPEIQSAEQMEKNGVSVNELQIQLLQKIEELTLYLIQQEQTIQGLQQQVEQLKK